VAEETYHKLKENRGTVTIKVEEVLLPIFARGLLNHREQRIVWAVISDSWRWRNAQYTQHPVSVQGLSEITGLNRANVSRIWRGLIDRRIILLQRDPDGRYRASFNEHVETWLSKRQRCQNDNNLLSNRQHNVVKTTTRGGDIAIHDNALQDPKNNIKNNIKNKRCAQKARTSLSASFNFIQWWKKTWSSYNSSQSYHWNGNNGRRLKQLLATFTLDELKTRAQFAFEHAGRPGPLEHFQPPFTFQQFAGENIINRCLNCTEGSAGYIDVDTLLEMEHDRETT